MRCGLPTAQFICMLLAEQFHPSRVDRTDAIDANAVTQLDADTREEEVHAVALSPIPLAASNAARWTARHGVGSHADAVELVAECSIPLT